MALATFLGEYILWQYSRGVTAFARAWMNVHWFLYHYFSIPILLKTFFAPFHRIQEHRGSGFDFQNFFETLIVNLMMRVVGMVVRTVIIVVGLLTQIVAFVLGGLYFLSILLFPLILAYGLIVSLVSVF